MRRFKNLTQLQNLESHNDRIAQFIVLCSRPSRQATLFSRQPRLPAGKPGTFTTCCGIQTQRSNFQADSASTLLLKVLSHHRTDAAIGELIGMNAHNAGQLTKDLRLSRLIEGNNKEKHPYQIAEKRKKYLANPPAEIEADRSTPIPPVSKTMGETVPPQLPASEEKPETEKDEAMGIPSQADTLRSIAEQLSITRTKDGTTPSLYPSVLNRSARGFPEVPVVNQRNGTAIIIDRPPSSRA